MPTPIRLRILSDLHREFGPTSIPPLRGAADLIVLAGDIATKQNGLPWIREFCGDTPAVYVCGNHEFYGDKLPRVTERLIDQTQGSGIHVLNDSGIALHGWFIYGCTLWTDMALLGDWPRAAALAAECMNDYKRIRNSSRNFRKLTPKDTRELHLRSVSRLTDFLGTHDPDRTIVVTHHAPSIRSLPESRRDKTISAAYASHLDPLIERFQPRLWIHGHIHHSNDYHIGRTRVLANPQGYPDSPNESFEPELIVALDPIPVSQTT